MALFRSIMTVSGWTLVSRVLGFVRTVLIAYVLGVGIVADAFFVAFRVANFFRGLFAEGAFNAAFVPLFSGRVTTEGRTSAVRFAGESASVLGAGFLILAVAAIAIMPWLMTLAAPGFIDDPAKFALAVDLTRIAFPYFLFMILVALLGGMLNSVQRFAATASAPVLLNVVMISVLAALSAGLSDAPGRALAWGVSAGGLAQLIWVAYACRRAGLVLRIPAPRLTPGVRRLAALTGPALIGAGVVQINLMVDVILASTLSQGSVSFLYYADRVCQLPLATVGVAVGVALLPLLTTQLRAGDTEAAHGVQNRAIEFSLALSLPAAAALMVISDSVVSALYTYGAFDSQAAESTAFALTAYAAGLPAYVLIRALTPGYYAREDTRTPVKIAIVATVANIGLSIILMQFLAHVGIALATALAAWLNAGCLGLILARRGHLRIDAQLRRAWPRVVIAAAAMALGLWLANDIIAVLMTKGWAWRAVGLAALVGGGVAAYGLLALLTGAIRMNDLKAWMSR